MYILLCIICITKWVSYNLEVYNIIHFIIHNVEYYTLCKVKLYIILYIVKCVYNS